VLFAFRSEELSADSKEFAHGAAEDGLSIGIAQAWRRDNPVHCHDSDVQK
jgi:hypothetical protein